MKRALLSMLLALAPCAARAADAPETLSKSARELWFCEPTGVDPAEVRRWCPLADDVAARCPGLAKACSKKEAVKAPARSEPPRRAEPIHTSSSPALGQFSNLLFWALVAALVAFVVAQIVRAAMGLRRDREESDAAPAQGPAIEVAADAPPVAKISDPERWLKLAEQAAENGRYAAALRAAYAALMHALRGRGLIELESGQSNGDVLRAISSEPELAQVFRGVSRELERVEFGGREATRQGFELAYAPVKLSVKRLIAVTAALAVAFLSLGCSADTTPARPADKGPEGYYLLRALLSASGSSVKERYAPLELLDQSVGRLVVTEPLEDESWGAILHWVSQGGHLVAAGIEDDYFEESTGVDTRHAACGTELQANPRKLRGLGEAQLSLQAGENWSIRVACGGDPYLVESEYGDGTITLIAEASFLQNASLTAADNALFVDTLLNGEEAIDTEIVGKFTGAAASSPMSSLRRSGLLPAVLQLLLLGAFFAWRYGAAFGRRRDPIESTSRRFVEHVRVLGACYERARATRLVLAEYGGWLLERASRRALGGRRGDVAETAAAISLRSGIHEGSAAALVAEVRIAQGAPDQNTPEDLQKVRQIESLVMKMGARS